MQAAECPSNHSYNCFIHWSKLNYIPFLSFKICLTYLELGGVFIFVQENRPTRFFNNMARSLQSSIRAKFDLSRAITRSAAAAARAPLSSCRPGLASSGPGTRTSRGCASCTRPPHDPGSGESSSVPEMKTTPRRSRQGRSPGGRSCWTWPPRNRLQFRNRSRNLKQKSVHEGLKWQQNVW